MTAVYPSTVGSPVWDRWDGTGDEKGCRGGGWFGIRGIGEEGETRCKDRQNLNSTFVRVWLFHNANTTWKLLWKFVFPWK